MNYKSIFILILCLLVNACQTHTAMTKKVPDKYIEVVPQDSVINAEASLKAAGANYTCKELFFANGSAKNRRVCYVKAPEDSRLKTLGVKMQSVPEAMLTDAGNAILVIGRVAIDIYLQSISGKMQ